MSGELPLQKRAPGREAAGDLPPPTKRRAPDPLTGERESERLSPGEFFAEHKATVDARRGPLARLGMDPRHVAALQMPDLAERPLNVMGDPAITPVHADAPRVAKADIAEGDEIPQAYSPKRPPRDAPRIGELPEA